ncbi:MAG TPA: hypothetical protein IAB01_07075 [Candidatus Avidesulfovibrio excrementigallinarum]|nr:hypothetical protein [Candidatus Avidesulfovibrio excrementigallinarum]
MDMESAFDMLSDDPSGMGLKQIREELFVMRSEVKRAMDAGMTADEMAVARQVMEAVDCADEAAGRMHDAMNR